MISQKKKEAAEAYVEQGWFKLEYSSFGKTADECKKAHDAGFDACLKALSEYQGIDGAERQLVDMNGQQAWFIEKAPVIALVESLRGELEDSKKARHQVNLIALDNMKRYSDRHQEITQLQSELTALKAELESTKLKLETHEELVKVADELRALLKHNGNFIGMDRVEQLLNRARGENV